MTPRSAWCHARAGLMLFYNPQHGTGIQISRTASSLVPPPGAHTGTRKRGPRAQLCESSTTVRRSTTRVPGKPWVKTEGSVELSGINHNVLGGFLDVQPAIYASGSDKATLRGFHYWPEIKIPA